MSEKQRSFVKGAATLAIAGLIAKVLGAIYRIPLFNLLGDSGMGVYFKAFPIYSWLLVISMAGLPNAVAKMVAERISAGDRNGAHRVFVIALRLLLVLGLVTTSVMLLFAHQFALIAEEPLAELSIAAIAPALFFVAAMSAYRGYFQGMHNMKPTAITQIAEQIIKMIFGFYLASRFMPLGIEYSAAGALLGITISEMLSWILIMIIYSKQKREWHLDASRYVNREPAKNIIHNLTKLAVPILIGSSIMPLTLYADSLIVTRMLEIAGFTEDIALGLFGIMTGAINTLVNMPAVLSLSLCVSLVPTIAAANYRADHRSIVRNSSTGLKYAILIGLPAAVGMSMLSEQIISLLFGSSLTLEKIYIGGQLLRYIAPGILFLSIVQTTNGAFQGLGKVAVPVISLGVGAAVKVILNIVLVSNPAINIYGASISTAVCYFIAAIINLVLLNRITGMRINLQNHIIKPLLASGGMALILWLLISFFGHMLGDKLTALTGVLLGIPVYFILLPITGCLTKDEIIRLPMGRTIYTFFNRIGAIK